MFFVKKRKKILQFDKNIGIIGLLAICTKRGGPESLSGTEETDGKRSETVANAVRTEPDKAETVWRGGSVEADLW